MLTNKIFNSYMNLQEPYDTVWTDGREVTVYPNGEVVSKVDGRLIRSASFPTQTFVQQEREYKDIGNNFVGENNNFNNFNNNSFMIICLAIVGIVAIVSINKR